MTRWTTVMALAVAAWAAPAPRPLNAGSKVHCPMPLTSLPYGTAPRVQLALLLDTSNSMDGLIDQARSQLWSVVNELAAARRHGQPVELQVALYEYGNNRLSPSRGHVRQVLPFTTDLDRVSEDLFALTTFGGDEYCGTVIQAALDQLRWNPSPADLKVAFIAGNEPFSQGPIPAEYQGASLLREAPGMALFYTDYSLGLLGLRDGCMKFIYELESRRSRLFDLCRDPGERHDVAAAFPGWVDFYRRRLERWSAAQKEELERVARLSPSE